MEPIRVTVWNEFLSEKSPKIAKVYPEGIHGAIQQIFAGSEQYQVRTATLEDPECGLSQ